jgi:hypothetical protein
MASAAACNTCGCKAFAPEGATRQDSGLVDYPRQESNDPQEYREKRESDNDAAQKAAQVLPASQAGAPDLQAIIEAWPTLPEAIRAGILAIVRAAGG